MADYTRYSSDLDADDEGELTAEEREDWINEPIALCPDHAGDRKRHTPSCGTAAESERRQHEKSMKPPQESNTQRAAVVPLRFAVYPGDIRSQRDGDIHHIGFARLCELYNVPTALCVDMSRPENRVGRDMSKLVALRPSYRGNYTLKASERGACPWDTDGDGDCHKCHKRPGGCFWHNAADQATDRA